MPVRKVFVVIGTLAEAVVLLLAFGPGPTAIAAAILVALMSMFPLIAGLVASLTGAALLLLPVWFDPAMDSLTRNLIADIAGFVGIICILYSVLGITYQMVRSIERALRRRRKRRAQARHLAAASGNRLRTGGSSTPGRIAEPDSAGLSGA